MICGSRVINSLTDGLSVTYFTVVSSHYCALIVCSHAILQDIPYHTHIHAYTHTIRIHGSFLSAINCLLSDND